MKAIKQNIDRTRPGQDKCRTQPMFGSRRCLMKPPRNGQPQPSIMITKGNDITGGWRVRILLGDALRLPFEIDFAKAIKRIVLAHRTTQLQPNC